MCSGLEEGSTSSLVIGLHQSEGARAVTLPLQCPELRLHGNRDLVVRTMSTTGVPLPVNRHR